MVVRCIVGVAIVLWMLQRVCGQVEYDFVIIGGGTAGNVLANRLTEEMWSVLVLEAGEDENPLTDIPVMTNIISQTSYNWGYKTEPQLDICLAFKESRCGMPRGKALGGSSVINHMAYTRGNKFDYDTWPAGWSWKEVEPYFRKLENVRIPELQTSSRGKYGPVSIEYADFRTNISKYFLEAGTSMGYQVNDPNGETQLGFSYLQQTLRNGRRCSSNKAYLQPVRGRKNLKVLTTVVVTKILINSEKRAYGVEYLRNKKARRVYVTKEVLLSAGVLSNPKILMLSGVGPKNQLQEFGIPLIQDLPVGHNLRDHVGTHLYVIVRNRDAVKSFSMFDPTIYFDYFLRGKGPLTSSRAEALAFVKLNNSRFGPDIPDIEILIAGSSFTPEIYDIFVRGINARDDVRKAVLQPLLGQEIFIMPVFLLQPKSVGSVRLRSANPEDPPIVDAKYLSEESDAEELVLGIKKAVEIINQPAMNPLNLKLHDAKFPDCLRFEFNTDDYWRCAIRQFTVPFQHQVGSCKMGLIEEESTVVDPHLRVKGIQGLRIVDTSIMPTPPRGHTQAAVYMVAEKAADLIKSTWR